MFIAALFTIVKTWKQPKCPSTEEWIKKMWYIYTMEYYSAIKQNKIMPFAATWMDLEIIVLSKPDRKRQISYDIAYIWNLKKKMIQMNLHTEQKQTHRHNKLMVTKGERRGGINCEFGININTLLYIIQITNKDLWYSTGNYTQHFVITYKGKMSGKRYINII